MKKKIIALLCTLLCIFGIVNNINVGANEYVNTITSTVTASETRVKANDTLSINVTASSVSNKISKFTYKLSYNTRVFKYTSFSLGQFENKEEVVVTNDVENGVIIAEYENKDNEVIFGNGLIISFMFKVNPVFEDSSFKFDLSGSDYYNANNEPITSRYQEATVDLYMASTDTKIRSLSIEEGVLSPQFNPNERNYTAVVDSSTLTIHATAPDKGRIGAFTGEVKITKQLTYGVNNIIIISTSEAGNTTEYKLAITRIDDRSSDNTLKSIKGVTNFKSDVMQYNVYIPTEESSFTAEAIANDEDATISYNPSSKRVSLDYGETKTIKITVSAANTSKREYILYVTRKDDRNSNNLLKSLTVSGATINFDPNVNSYRVMLDNKYNNTIITALPQTATSVVTGAGVVPLKEGSNNISIVVKAENGSEKVYTLVIIRKDSEGKISDLSNNTNLKYLRFNTTNINLQQGVYSYEISLPNSSEMGEIFYETEDSKAIVSLEGNRDLIVGKNYYRIRVTAENGQTVVYELTVIRQQIQNFIENNRQTIIDAIKTSTDIDITVSVEHNDNERIVDTSIIETLKNTNKTLTYQVFDSNKILNYSVSIKAEDIVNIKTLDYRLKNVTSNQNRIDTLSNAKKTVYLNFEGAKEIPGKTKVKANVSETFTQENVLTLYYYNDETDALELVEDNLYVNGGYVEFNINNMGDHILIDKTVMKMSESDSTTILIVFGVIIGLVILILLIKLIKRKRSMVKIPSVNKDTDNNKENIQDNTKTEVDGNK